MPEIQDTSESELWAPYRAGPLAPARLSRMLVEHRKRTGGAERGAQEGVRSAGATIGSFGARRSHKKREQPEA